MLDKLRSLSRSPCQADQLQHTFEPIAHDEERVALTTVAQVGEHIHPELGTFPALAGPQTEYVALTVEAACSVARPRCECLC